MSIGQLPNSDQNTRTLVDELLAEQRSLTAVEQFSLRHEEDDAHSQAKFYRDLIPLHAPAHGQQYAFEVDLDKCSGCKACVTACHSLNGLDDEETWREVGLLHSDDWRAPFQANVTTACHHCVDPGCLNGCPVLAYDKDPLTGIVRHLDDQCIGCQYCVMKCPYDAPKYSAKRGIVRKCDMCSNRLGRGEAPACVQACPSQAIRITLVERDEILNRFRGEDEGGARAATSSKIFLPASPAANHTVPTTLYKSSRPLPEGLLSGDHARVVPADSHLPLVFMLVLSQLSVGASAAAIVFEPAKWFATAALGFGTIALVSGTLHLGQPLKAWRAFLGWRKSWFSREVIVFGAFVPLAALSVASLWLKSFALPAHLLSCAASGVGLIGVACSAMIYVDTHREFWRASQSFGKFFGTTLLLGSVTALAFSVVPGQPRAGSHFFILAGLVCALTVAKLGFENRVFEHRVDEETPAPAPLSKTARLLDGQLASTLRSRIAVGLIGGLLLPVLMSLGAVPSGIPMMLLGCATWALCVIGELLERYLFFTAVAPAKMPGGVA